MYSYHTQLQEGTNLLSPSPHVEGAIISVLTSTDEGVRGQSDPRSALLKDRCQGVKRAIIQKEMVIG